MHDYQPRRSPQKMLACTPSHGLLHVPLGRYRKDVMDASILARSVCLTLSASLALAPMASLAAVDNGFVTVGSKVSPPTCTWGYFPPSIGSYSPTVLTGFATVLGVYDIIVSGACLGSAGAVFSASGFSFDPGKAWLTSISCNGVTKTGSTAITYFFAGGSASWHWASGNAFGFSGNTGAQLPCTIVHN